MTQATFLTFFEAAPRFEGRSTVRTFLLGILYRKLQEARRGFHKDRRHDDIDEVMERRFDDKGAWRQPPRAADRSLYDREIVEHTARCLEKVPQRQKLAFLLREVEGLSTRETCNALQVSATNLGVMLYRARNRLRECLEKQGIFGAT
ncbi:MAG: sigma-70 family RNA polymerase sigma factor [Acidobacteriota bacterium]|nr:sigma-70 family RNA polymerase sigma factor [Acidobacteriota bacterium]